MSNTPTDHPNVLVLFCDQLRRDLLGCYGGTVVRTPNIDALAADGMVFDEAYTPTAICSPARVSLMTGQYAHAHHMFNNSSPGYSYCQHLRPGVHMIQDWAAAETGYRTGYFGKWHIGPAEDLFASRFHRTHPRPYDGGPHYLHNSHWHPSLHLGPLVENSRVDAIPPSPNFGAIRVPMEQFPDVAAARYTREFISEDDDRPFLAFCAFPGPHSPWLVPEEFGIRYRPEDIPLWPNRNDPLHGKPLGQQKLRVYSELSAGTHARLSDDLLRRKLAVCFSYIELIDECVGELVAHLKREGRYEKTTILFTADHGDMAGSHGFASKGSYMYDEIYRIPMLLKPAGPIRPTRRSEPVHLMDVTATCMHAMVGAECATMTDQPLHGQSLLPLAEGTAAWPRPVHYAQYHGDWYGHTSARMVTDGKWKLVWNLLDLGELYHLEEDPGELNNRYYDPYVRDVRTRYFEHLLAAAERYDDGQAKRSRWSDDPGAADDLLLDRLSADLPDR